MAEMLLIGLQKMACKPILQVLQLCDGTSLMSETEVTVLGVTIDDKLCQRLL